MTFEEISELSLNDLKTLNQEIDDKINQIVKDIEPKMKELRDYQNKLQNMIQVYEKDNFKEIKHIINKIEKKVKYPLEENIDLNFQELSLILKVLNEYIAIKLEDANPNEE